MRVFPIAADHGKIAQKNRFCVLRDPSIHIVLDRPRIAANIASIVRLSTGVSAALHVCGPLLFDPDDKTKWRAGLDYFYGSRVHFHLTLERCLNLLGKKPFIVEVGGHNAPWNVTINKGDIFIFGPENASVDSAVCQRYPDRLITLPQPGLIRSYNLAQCTAALSFEALRQLGS